MEDFSQLNYTGLEIAVVGMSGRFPGANSVEKFWQNIRAGVEGVTFFSEEELRACGVTKAELDNPDYVRAKGFVEDAEMLDAHFFGYNPREAEIIDPQQRLFLECAWEALEGAGYDPARCAHPVGVYAGVGFNTYAFRLAANAEAIRSVGMMQATIGNDKDFIATRVSYKLNLKGPSVSVQTACSTSLVAVHLACQALLSGACGMALAGGAAISFPEKAGYVYQKEGILSPDGRCRAFDARAQGTVGGNGVGVVLLKRLEDALADGDTVHAVIKGSAVNNDGADKVGYTAPSVEGQAEVIRAAQMMAEVSPETIGYVETHGTGTSLGDPIEITALTRAFRAGTSERNFCAVGSVKTNIGHLDTAAGVAGLIKAVMALKNRELPPSLHFERPNPNIDFESSPFYVNSKLAEWDSGGRPRRAGVSSFGIGGTNAHVVLEEAPPAPAPQRSERPLQLLLMSAKTETALEQVTANLACRLAEHPELNLADVAYTLQTGRGQFAHRRFAVCGDASDAERALAGLDPKRVRAASVKQEGGPVVMMFPGQGAQYVGMGGRLYEHEATFRRHVDACAELLRPHLECDLRELLFASGGRADAAAERLRQTAFTQPALFAVEYALAQLWMAWGVRPAALLGHSLGEYVAACVAGVFSLEDALRLVALRGRLMQSVAGGAMLSVPLAEAEVSELLRGRLGEEVSLAAVNAPALCVVAGRPSAVEEFERELAARGVEGRRLHTSHAFHSKMVEPVVGALVAAFERVTLRAPQTPFVSNVTGRWITEAEACDPSYWGRQLREPVMFAAGVGQLLELGRQVLLEVGPGNTLATLARQHPKKAAASAVLSSLPSAKEAGREEESLLMALGQLWLNGVEVEWERLHEGERRRRLTLPTYPFERQRYSVGATRATRPGGRRQESGKKPDVADWFYVPLWKQSLEPARTARGRQSAGQAGGARRCLVFADELGLGTRVAERLRADGAEVVEVSAGAAFESLGDDSFVIDLRSQTDYQKLIRRLQAEGRPPQFIMHLWGVDGAAESARQLAQHSRESVEESQARGFYSLLFLARALEQEGVSGEVHLCAVTSGVRMVTGAEELRPEKATALGPCHVIPQEYTNVVCRSIDVEVPPAGTAQERRLASQLASEMRAEAGGEKSVAYRGARRWVQTYEPLRLEEETDTADSDKSAPPPLRERGVYLLTGGLGGIALGLARYLAEAVSARLVLVGRRELPPRERWAEWVAARGADDAVSQTLLKLQQLEEAGAEVEVVRADVAREEELRAAVGRARERFGALHGVIHAAGVTGTGAVVAVSETGRLEAERHFQAKVYGLLTLEKVLRGSGIDFCLLTSSLSSVLGGIGFAAYAAANAFMDAFAHRQSQSESAPWISVNWDGWTLGKETAGGSFSQGETSSGITVEEGVGAFRRLLRTQGLPQLIVSASDLQTRISRWIDLTPTREGAAAEEVKANALYSRPDLGTVYRAPSGETEQAIADIWQTLLGVERVGADDSFFELGGHSLLATQLVSRLREKFRIELSLRGFFEAPTVADLARLVARRPATEEDERLEQLLREVEGLSEAEVELALSGGPPADVNSAANP